MQIWISDDQTQIPLTEAQIEIVRRVITRAIEVAAPDLGAAAQVSVSFVDDAAIQMLNREHRGYDKPTDVLSFSQLEGEEMAALPEGEPLLLGDVVISVERCRAQAAEYDHAFERELGFLVAHGVLHLLGFDHQTPADEAAMTAAVEEILAPLGLQR